LGPRRAPPAITELGAAPPGNASSIHRIELIRPMEVLLNTIWLLVAIGAFFLWRPERFRGTPAGRGHRTSLAILALATALVLLFPVISLTDDLHAGQAAMEDSSRSVMKARSTVQDCLRAGRSPLLAAAPPASFSAAGRHLPSGAAVIFEICMPCLPPISAHEGRAPPSNG